MTADTIAKFRQHLRKRNIDRNDERADLPARVVDGDGLRVRGSVHLACGAVASRKDTNRRFAKLRFA